MIRGAGDTAIRVTEQAVIENAGQIDGGVALGQYGDRFYQRIGGSVAGNIAMGDGDDQFWREGNATGVAGMPSGTLDGGDGIDIYGIRMTGSGTVAFGSLPTGFERYGLDLCGCNLDVTIAAENLTGALSVSGPGVVTNLASFTYAGSDAGLEIRAYNASGNGGTLTGINRGALNFTGISAPESGPPVALIDANDFLTGFVNDTGGTINLSGEAIYGIRTAGRYAVDSAHGFINRGSIHAEGLVSTAVAVSGSGYNSGTISSAVENGVALSLEGVSAQFVNDTGGVIRGDRAVSMQYGASLTNRGTIVATGENAAVSGYSTQYYRAAKLINEGEIRAGAGAAVELYSEAPYGAQVANKGTIVGDVVLGGSGKDMLWLAEGSAVQGNVSTGNGDDKLVVDLRRLGQDGSVNTGGLVTGAVDMGAGNNVLQARAGESQAFSVLRGNAAGFSGGTIYEAAGAGTVLTLQGPADGTGGHYSYDGLLRVAGDGRVVLDMNFNNGGYDRPSIVVEKDSTSSVFGEEGRGLDLVIAGAVNGGTAGIAVDATHARRVELLAQSGYIGITGGTALKTGAGTEVLISASSNLRKMGNAYGVLLEADGSTITNRASIWEDSKDASTGNFGLGVDLRDGMFTNDRGNLGIGRVSMQGTGIRMENSTVYNSGDIVSAHGNAIETVGYGVNRIVNRAAGTIQGHATDNAAGTAGAAIVGGNADDIVENAGTITGHVLLGNGNDLYVANGGKVTGDLDMGNGDDTVLTRNGAALDVSGTVSGGAGIDAYGRSFTSNGTFDLTGNVLPAGFEMHGVEASGAQTEVTVTSATTQTRGLRALGDGKVINNANFDIADDTLNAAIEVTDPRFEAQLDLVNNGTITSTANGVLAYGALSSFANTGAITARGNGLSVYRDYGIGAFTLNNSGRVASTEGHGVRVYSYGVDEAGRSIDVTNSGQITASADGGNGMELQGEGGLVRLANTGTIGAASLHGSGASISARSFDVTNGGTIESTGGSGTGLLLTALGGAAFGEDCPDPQQPVLVGKLVNSGRIAANGGGSDGGSSPDIATGVFAALLGDNGIVGMTNAAGGTIEATGGVSAALMVAGLDDEGYGSAGVDAALRLFELDNLGMIRGGADTVLHGDSGFEAGGVYLHAPGDSTTETYVIAGGIQTMHTTDKIRNLAGGTIIGNVDLGQGDDRFENYGTLQGDLRLGDGNDTFVYGASGIFTGIAYGGEGTDVLLVDVNGGGASAAPARSRSAAPPISTR